MGTREQFEDDLAALRQSADILQAIVHGPATGEPSLVQTNAGPVKTAARVLDELLDHYGPAGPQGPSGWGGDDVVLTTLQQLDCGERV